jgi:CPA2 family monovalent cation:H+ antiporter-2
LLNIAELGVALLLFAIGLEFSPRRLLTLGKRTLWLGLLQMFFTTLAAFTVALTVGLGPGGAFVVGLMIAMSSTATVLRLLRDRAEIDSQYGRTSLGILLVQDIVVVPMMLLVSVMAAGRSPVQIAWQLSLAALMALLLVGLFYFVFHVVAPHLLSLPTMQKNRDLPVLLAVIMAVGSAWATHHVGLSPALGAFAAGVLLAVSPFSTQIRADTRSLTTILVTLFFAAIGMFGDPKWLLGHWPVVAGIVLGIVLGKPLIIAFLSRACGHPWRDAVAAAVCLAQVGEFSFVLAVIAQGDGDGTAIISPTVFRAMVSVTVVTLLLTPYFVAAAPRVGAGCHRMLTRQSYSTKSMRQPLDASEQEQKLPETPPDVVIIVGFGPAGQRVAEGLLESHQHQMVAIDLNPNNIEIAQRYGLEFCIGDATQRDVLDHVNLARARVVVLTLPDHTVTRQMIHLVRDLAPQAFIIARCRYHILHWELLHAGAHEVVDEEDQIGRRLAAQVRKYVGRQAEEDA